MERDRVWHKIVVLGVTCSVPHSTELRFLVVFNTTLSVHIALSENIGGHFYIVYLCIMIH